MAQTLSQLVTEMQGLRQRLGDGSARTSEGEAATGDVDAAIAALDDAIAALTGRTGRDETEEHVAVADAAETPALAPYAIVDIDTGPPNNLTLIRGISSATAHALNGVGITRFAHLAGMTARDVTQLNSDLGYRCTISRNNWIEQAALLAKGETTSFSRRGGPMGMATVSPWTDTQTHRSAINPPALPDATHSELETDDTADTAVIPASAAIASIAGAMTTTPDAVTPESSDIAESGDEARRTVVSCKVEKYDRPLPPERDDLYAAGPFEDLLPAPEPDPTALSDAEHEPAATIAAPINSLPILDEDTSASDVIATVETDTDSVKDDDQDHTISGEGIGALAGILATGAVATQAQAFNQEANVEPPLEPDHTTSEHDAHERFENYSNDDVFATLPEPVAVLPDLDAIIPDVLPPTARVLDEPVNTQVSPVPEEQNVVRPEDAPIFPPEARPEPQHVPQNIELPTVTREPAAVMQHEPETAQPPTATEPEHPAPTGLGAMLASANGRDAAPIGNSVPDDRFPTFQTLPDRTPDIPEAPFAPIIQSDPTSFDAHDGGENSVRIHVSDDADGAIDSLRTALDEQFSPLNGQEPRQHVPVSERLSPSPATIDPLPEPFSPHKTAVDEAEIMIVRDGETQAAALNIPRLDDRDGNSGFVGKLSRMFGRKS